MKRGELYFIVSPEAHNFCRFPVRDVSENQCFVTVQPGEIVTCLGDAGDRLCKLFSCHDGVGMIYTGGFEEIFYKV
jgi:hypothetical protein